MADRNTNSFSFENGGTLTITESGANAVFMIKEATLTWKPAIRARILCTDRGVQQAPREGNDQYGELTCTVRCGSLQGSSALYTLLMTAATSGVVKEFSSVILDQPTYRGSTTGDRVTFGNCHVPGDRPPEWKAGDGTNDNELTFTLLFRTIGPSIAAMA